ncbi:MAG: nickel pincer cofactor biosynthesis protein LarC [Synergistaceae bacterium]|jgi:uncharacterized protein (TIGR00299 family) protein|nr:nickel pincer cofactor biosynthesis protein LarC [Synergistaceae bacterium]
MDITRGNIIYLDANSGISGDMFLGAMTDIATRLDPAFDLLGLLSRVALSGWELAVARGKRAGIEGLKIDIHAHECHPRRHLADILDILEASDISGDVRRRASEAFTMLAEAEAKVHGTTPEEIHFHEVGAVDSIIDIAGAMLIAERLGWPEILSSPVNVGSGAVKCAHGILPVPAPATAILLEGLRIFSGGEPMERTTPTGALILKSLVGAGGFRPLPEGSIICAGVGLGGRDTPDLPNVLRALLFSPSRAGRGRFERDEPMLLEANIDDMNPQDFALAMERLLGDGALDAWCENIMMKKGRPAVKLCCLAARGDEARIAETMMRETTTIGVRMTETRRLFMRRSAETRATPLGDVRFKFVSMGDEPLRGVPEYEDLLKIAREKSMTIGDVRRVIGKLEGKID